MSIRKLVFGISTLTLVLPLLAACQAPTAGASRTQTASAANGGGCTSIPRETLERGPFADLGGIDAVEEIIVSPPKGVPHRKGARVLLYPRQGVTAEYLGHAIGCHRAFHTAGATAGRNASASPLHVEGANVRVSPHGDRLAIAIESNDRDVANTVIERARSLVTTRQ